MPAACSLVTAAVLLYRVVAGSPDNAYTEEATRRGKCHEHLAIDMLRRKNQWRISINIQLLILGLAASEMLQTPPTSE